MDELMLVAARMRGGMRAGSDPRPKASRYHLAQNANFHALAVVSVLRALHAIHAIADHPKYVAAIPPHDVFAGEGPA